MLLVDFINRTSWFL